MFVDLFYTFKLGMNSFASKGDTQHKLRFAFNIYDIGKRLILYKFVKYYIEYLFDTTR